MKTAILPILIVVAQLLTGCASDPLAQMLKQNGGFGMVRPPSGEEWLGDVHPQKNLLITSISMNDVMGDGDLKEMMRTHAKPVSLSSSSGEKIYSLDVAAAYAGIAKAQLKGSLVRRYSVAVRNPVEYGSPLDSHLSAVLIPAIKKKFPSVPLQGKFIVSGLLKVDGLEYEFYREDGGKIDLSVDPKLVANLTAALGSEWKVSDKTKLSISEPRFVGYRLVRIDADGRLRVQVSAGGPISDSSEIRLSKVAPSEYEDVDLRKRKHGKH